MCTANSKESTANYFFEYNIPLTPVVYSLYEYEVNKKLGSFFFEVDKLRKEEIEFITQCLKQGKPLPDNYMYTIPFETKKEYELIYEGKEREKDI